MEWSSSNFLFLEQLHFKNSRMIMAAAACDPRPIKNMWRHLLKKPALAAMLLWKVLEVTSMDQTSTFFCKRLSNSCPRMT
jgi:hypothetical protein